MYIMSPKRGPKMVEPSYDDVFRFAQQHSCPFVTSADVAAEFPKVSDKTIRKRLNELVDRGKLKSRRVGAHAKVWYIPRSHQ